MKIILPAGHHITLIRKDGVEEITVEAVPGAPADGDTQTFKVISIGKDHVTLQRNGQHPFHLQKGDDLVVTFHPAKILGA